MFSETKLNTEIRNVNVDSIWKLLFCWTIVKVI